MNQLGLCRNVCLHKKGLARQQGDLEHDVTEVHHLCESKTGAGNLSILPACPLSFSAIRNFLLYHPDAPVQRTRSLLTLFFVPR